MFAMLATLLIAQAPTISDWGFVRAQEDFVIDSLPASRRMAGHVPPATLERILALGEDHWHCRERARRELTDDPGSHRWLFWGLRSKEASIRYGCWLVLRDVASCPYCHGTDECGGFRPNGIIEWACRGCGNSDMSHWDPDLRRACLRCRFEGAALDITRMDF